MMAGVPQPNLNRRSAFKNAAQLSMKRKRICRARHGIITSRIPTFRHLNPHAVAPDAAAMSGTGRCCGVLARAWTGFKRPPPPHPPKKSRAQKIKTVVIIDRGPDSSYDWILMRFDGHVGGTIGRALHTEILPPCHMRRGSS